MGCLNFLLKVSAFLGVVLFICYPIGALLSKGPMSFVGWIIAGYIAIKVGKFIYNL